MAATAAYVTSNFIGGAIGSAAGSVAWSAGGWSAVCAVGVAFAGVAMVVWLTEGGHRAERRERQATVSDRALPRSTT